MMQLYQCQLWCIGVDQKWCCNNTNVNTNVITVAVKIGDEAVPIANKIDDENVPMHLW